MGIARAKYYPAAWNVDAKPCDVCTSAAAVVFCRADAAFMCIACDTKVHAAASVDKHGRVWMCEVCEQAPAAVTCKADAAALCVDCDRDIHSANPLAGRHDRVSVVSFFGSAESALIKSTSTAAVSFDGVFPDADSTPTSDADRKIDFISDPWIAGNTILAATKFPADNLEMKSMEFLFSDSDQFLDYDSYQVCSQPYGDSVVPVQVQQAVKPLAQEQFLQKPAPENRFEIDFTKPSITSFNNTSYATTPSLSHSFSTSSMEVGVVPDGNAMSDISYPFVKSMNSAADDAGNQGSLGGGNDREARVLRYKEKRKNRKFEKTIRYASRKAYAETRPRIKGRFAKRTDAETEFDGVFGFGVRYGVVPSF